MTLFARAECKVNLHFYLGFTVAKTGMGGTQPRRTRPILLTLIDGCRQVGLADESHQQSRLAGIVDFAFFTLRVAIDRGKGNVLDLNLRSAAVGLGSVSAVPIGFLS